MKKRRFGVLFAIIMTLFLMGCGSDTDESISLDIVQGTDNDSTTLVEIDPFENVTIEYDGDSYSGTVKKINNSAIDDFLSKLTFAVDKDYGLANGDTITVSIKYVSEINEAMEHNYILTRTEKEYIVEGLPYYVYSLAEIPDDLMEEMKDIADAKMADYLSNNFHMQYEEIINIESEYIGNLLWTFKSISAAYANHCYFVYKNHIKTLADEFDCYYYVDFYDLYMDTDGTVTRQVEFTGQPNGTAGESFEHGERMYEGFESVENMITSWYKKCGENWNCDSSIME